MPGEVQVDPKLIRYVVLSKSGEKAAVGMVAMQLWGFHFVRALEGGLDTWSR